jgi:hypothetical protein
MSLLLLAGMFTDIDLAWAKGMGPSIRSGYGNRSENSDHSKLGDHVGSWIPDAVRSNAIAWYVINAFLNCECCVPSESVSQSNLTQVHDMME